MMISIIGPFLAGIYICGDFENKSIHDAISSCGLSRITVIISKAIVYYLMVIFMLMPYAIVTVIAFASGKEFCNPIAASVFLKILENQTGLSFTLSVFIKMIIIMFVMMIAYASQMSVSVFLSFVFKKPALVIGLGFVSTMVLQIIGGLGVKLVSLKNILSFTPFSVGFKVLTMEAGADVILKALGVSLLFIVWIISMTNGAFRKSEIK